MEDKWELFWMMMVFFIVLMIATSGWNWRIDSQRDGAWNSGYMAGYAEGKSGMTNRLASVSERKVHEQ